MSDLGNPAGKLLVAIDTSPAARLALDYAADLAAARGLEVVVVTVIPDLDAIDTDLRWRSAPGFEHRLSRIGQSTAAWLLSQARRHLESRGVARVSVRVVVGDVAAAVCALAHETAAERIIVGTRGRSRFVGALLGSISQKLQRISSIPVTIVRRKTSWTTRRPQAHPRRRDEALEPERSIDSRP